MENPHIFQDEIRNYKVGHPTCALKITQMSMWVVQDGAPQWGLLVYKPWNNPHEYYSYIYHKP